MKLTAENAAKLKLPPGKTDAIFWDDDLPRFGVRVRSSGKRTWVIQYHASPTTHKRMVLGAVGTVKASAAREKAKAFLAAVSLGQDPQAAKIEDRDRAAITMGSVVPTYLAARERKTIKGRAIRARTLEETARYLNDHWQPLHKLRMDKIGRADISGALLKIRERGPVAELRAHVALTGLFSWAVKEGLAPENPVALTNKPSEPVSRDRVLTDDELGAIWNGCRDDDYGRIVRLLILTLQRRDEVGSLPWSEVDAAKSLWELPGERAKNHCPNIVPLMPAAVALLDAVERRPDKDSPTLCLFGVRGAGFTGWSKAKAALDARIAQARAGDAGKPRPLKPWRLHDLRRTGSTVMQDRLGVLPHIAEAILNHISGHKAGAAGVYNRAVYLKEKTEALAMWADFVESVTGGGSRKIIPLNRRA